MHHIPPGTNLFFLNEQLNEDVYKVHIKNKDLARRQKTFDKALAQNDDTLKVYTFDLQSVLYSPCSQVSSFYYTRKFCTYNNTLIDLVTKEGFCYFWHENNGKRGSDEIGSSLYIRLSALPKHVKNVVLYSDCFGAQNRNRYIAALLMYLSINLWFDTIQIKFLKSGHTQMEVDSMHSTIERAKKNKIINYPKQWETIMQNARCQNPYYTKEMEYADIYDLKKLLDSFPSNFRTDSGGENVSWLQVKVIKVCKHDSIQVFFQTDWEAEQFNSIPLNPPKRTQKAWNSKAVKLKRKYSSYLPVSAAKKRDLLKLCDEGLLNKNAKLFFQNLQSSLLVRDCLPEPDIFEDDESDN